MLTASLLDVDTASEAMAPVLSLSGGELPKINIDAADIKLDTNKVVVEVPSIEVSRADAHAER